MIYFVKCFRKIYWTNIRKGSTSTGASNMGGVGKIRDFQPVTRHVSEMVQDRTKVTIND